MYNSCFINVYSRCTIRNRTGLDVLLLYSNTNTVFSFQTIVKNVRKTVFSFQTTVKNVRKYEHRIQLANNSEKCLLYIQCDYLQNTRGHEDSWESMLQNTLLVQSNYVQCKLLIYISYQINHVSIYLSDQKQNILYLYNNHYMYLIASLHVY